MKTIVESEPTQIKITECRIDYEDKLDILVFGYKFNSLGIIEIANYKKILSQQSAYDEI